MPSSKGKSLISREWLREMVHQLILAKEPITSSSSRGVPSSCQGLIVSGGNGCGKTTFLKSLIWNNFDQFGSGLRDKISRAVLSFQFCCTADIETLSVAKFVLNMAAKLVDNDEFSSYTKQISESSDIREYINSVSAEKDPETAFREGILKPLNKLFQEDSFSSHGGLKQYVFLVDLPDHDCTSCAAHECIASLLAANMAYFPKWIKLVITGTKRSLQALLATEKLHEVALDNIANWDVQRDIYSFAETSLHKVSADEMSTAKIRKLVDNIVTLSKGSFHVATAAIQYVTISFASLRKQPVLMSLDVNSLLSETFKLVFGTTERKRILAVSILDILYASQQSFTASCLYKTIENGCSSQVVTFQEFESCMEKLGASQMISESNEGRIYLTELARSWLVVDGKAIAGFNVR